MATEDFDVYFARAAALYRQSTSAAAANSLTSSLAPAKFTFDVAPSASAPQQHQQQQQQQQQPTGSEQASPSSPIPSSATVGGVAPTSATGDGRRFGGSLRPPRRSVSCKYPAGNRQRLSPKSCLRGETDDGLPSPPAAAAAVVGFATPPHLSSPSSSSSVVALLSADDSAAAGASGTRAGGGGSGLCAGLLGAFGAAAIGFPSSAASLAAAGAKRTSNSAPHSRSSSWRKARRPKDSLLQQSMQWNQNGTMSGISIESEVIDKLQQLKLMQEDDYCVVRSFRTTPSRGIVSRGDDQFRRLNIVGGATTSSIDDSMNSVQTASTHAATSTASSTDDTPTGRKQHQVTEVAVTGKNGGGNLQTTEIHKVIVVGMTNVGKTALLQQFMTSHYMAAVCTSFDDEFAKTVTVVVDDDEMMTLDFVDVGTWSPLPSVSSDDDGQNSRQVLNDKATSSSQVAAVDEQRQSIGGRVDAYLVVYSMTDPSSFRYAVEVACELRRRPAGNRVLASASTAGGAAAPDCNHNNCTATCAHTTSATSNGGGCSSSSSSPVIIMVANKSDLVRTRQVSKTDAKCACNLMNCKYIEVSASLNHRVDELLVGIVRQIRKRHQLQRNSPPSNVGSDSTGLRRRRSARNRPSSTSSATGSGDRATGGCGGSGGNGSGDSIHSLYSGSTTSIGRSAVGCPDGPAAAALCSVRAAKELIKELFVGSDAAACLQAASDTDCENLLEL